MASNVPSNVSASALGDAVGAVATTNCCPGVSLISKLWYDNSTWPTSRWWIFLCVMASPATVGLLVIAAGLNWLYAVRLSTLNAGRRLPIVTGQYPVRPPARVAALRESVPAVQYLVHGYWHKNFGPSGRYLDRFSVQSSRYQPLWSAH